MDSVECGYDEKTGKSLAGEMLGTDSGHKKTHALLCQEYVLQSERVIYRIRPKDEKHPVLRSEERRVGKECRVGRWWGHGERRVPGKGVWAALKLKRPRCPGCGRRT